MRRALAVCLLAALLPAVSLGALFVSANKTVFVWGESVKVSAILTDESGRVLPMGPVTWSVDVPANATVAADGAVTPRAMQSFVVRAAASGLVGEVRMQPVPKQIVVVPESASMTVGATQRMRADVLDVNDRPIPNIPVTWGVTSQYFDFTPSASIDPTGTLTAVTQARVRVRAQIRYSSTLPGFDQVAQGETLVDIKAPVTYRFERIYVAKVGGAATSTLAPRPSQLVPTESGGFMFAASLDGLGSALLEWKDGTVKPLLVSGRANIQNGYPLSDFTRYTRSLSGEVLAQEIDTGNGTLVSRGPADLITPLLANGSAVFGAQSTYSVEISRNSLAGSGAMLIQVGYVDAVTHKSTTGLFRGFGRGYSEPVINTFDDRLDPSDVPANILLNHYGIADDGTAWFFTVNRSALWRSRPSETPKKMLSVGDPIGDGAFLDSAGNFTGATNLFVSSNGDAIAGISTTKGSKYLLYHKGDETPSDVLTAPATGLFWYDPNVGALIDTTLSSRRGLYLWNKGSAKPLLLLNDTSLDGSPVQEVISAACTSDGTIYVMARTSNNLMLIARLTPNPAVLLRAGDALPVAVPPVISALIPGARKGMPLVIAGGLTGSIAQLNENGDLNAIVRLGERLPDQKFFVGSQLSGVRTVPDGRIVFAQNLFASDTGIYTWNNGTIDLTMRAPLTTSTGVRVGTAQAFEVNRRGDIAVKMGFAGNGVFFVRDGRVTQVATPDVDIDGVKIGNYSGLAIDEGGNVFFGGARTDGSDNAYGVWDGDKARIVLTPQTKMPDGRLVTGIGVAKGCEDGFLLGMLGTYGRYRNGNWDYLASPTDPTATGAPANNLGSNYDANRSCDVAFTANFSADLGTRANSKFQEIQDLNQLTPEGDLLSVVQVLINDDGTVYVLGGNDRGEEVIYRATALQ